MADVLRVPLSVHQQARFSQIRAEEQALTERKSEAVTTIVAGHVDPASLSGWDIQLGTTEIVCSPPAPATEKGDQ